MDCLSRTDVEHAFAPRQGYGLAHQVYRNRQKGGNDRSMVTVAGLWKLYVEAA